MGNKAHRARYWVLFLLAMAVSGCLQPKQEDALSLLVRADGVITTGWEELGQAANLGVVDTASSDYAKAYDALDRADSLMDIAWHAYKQGNALQASQSRDAALAAYRAIRPMLTRWLGGQR